MTPLKSNEKFIENYLKKVFGEKIRLKNISRIHEDEVNKDFKGFGYGEPYLIEFEKRGTFFKIVLSTMRGDEFGHEFTWDRSHSILMAYSTFNKIPRHVKSIDVGTLMKDGSLISLGNYKEFFLITEYIEGTEYWKDLNQMGRRGTLTHLDLKRSSALAKYLVKIHSKKLNAPNLYRRRIRELIGHGECIMGLVDSYAENLKIISSRDLQSIENKCLEWRWKLKNRHNRLSQIHGDYHPWNILFRKGVDFTVLDRSRGEWGEPADDIAAMVINYIFFSLKYYNKFKDPFKNLTNNFINSYIKESGDQEVLEVIQPFYVWRALVLASPIWYPNLKKNIRKRLIRFIIEILEKEKVELDEINSIQ